MNSPAKMFLMLFFAAAACFDLFTTFTGMRVILNSDSLAVAATFFINGLLLFTFYNFDNKMVDAIIKTLLFGAFACDFYTAWKGSESIAQNAEGSGKTFVTFIVTAIAVGGTIITSYFLFEKNPVGLIDEKDETDLKKKD